MRAPSPIIRDPDEGERRLFLGGGMHVWKLNAAETGGAMFLFEDVLVRGKCTPLHAHPDADEVVYVLDGELLVNHDGVETLVTTGGVTFMPRGTPHAFSVRSASARILTMQTPGHGDAFYLDASEPAVDDTVDEVDIARIQASARSNPEAITLLGPPPFAPA